MRTFSLFGFLAITLSLAGCADDDPITPATTATGIEIEGTWTSDFGTDVITDDSWSSDFGSGPFVSTIAEFSNSKNVAITVSPDDGTDSGKYNRIVWTEIAGDSFYYCTTDFGLATLDEAREASSAVDASDPETTGCGTFPWSKLSSQ